MFDPGVAKAKKCALDILHDFGLEHGGEADLQALAFALGLVVMNRSMRGAEGRLIQKDETAIATINDQIRHERKRSFVIAHELGHYKLHRESPLFLCDESDFVDWHRRRPEETEANQFAAELLMPAGWFRRNASAAEFSREEVSRLADTCGVSLTAAAFRCVELDIVPCAIAFCKDEKIKWSNVSRSFPYQYMRGSGSPDGYSGAGEYFAKGSTPRDPVPTFCDAWFKDYSIDSQDELMEQCIAMNTLNATLSLIWQV